ncbi:hypothetical protein [Polyangium jinanense]|uniref:Uncharacterized protein n=1 Tax=Polyangium jinanense TaxID=2829994 RepID=A0A9X4AXA3_9BACT|nr:hypothetical protein [Polyangium jinanense]MDC3961793.1 hypothetical protein [Polyangium jinanense]MDC3988313.1 hypothetical protein [Polyangium jinanense]MDC3989510.1 hypothetical protein [Polyangium jinanense]
MATHLRPNTSAQPAADICAAIADGLASDEATKHLAPLWESLTAKGDALAAEGRKQERALGRARARLAVADAQWDPEVASFGRDVVDKTGGRRDVPPYTRFFKDVSPSAAQAFGIDREVKQGREWLDELGRNPDEPLALKWSPRLGTVTDKLDDTAKERANGLRALALQGTSEELYVEDINLELDRLEGDLKKLFPGQPKRVAAFLEPTRPKRKREAGDADEGPEGEDS